ncbi:NAD(P)-binding protein [Whalleya microplaca]|nr:NAD(P)-binding protein [Whalleya microplaca]
MSLGNHINKVAIVGADGFIGKYFVEELLKLGQHEVTAISRIDSKAVIPEGVKVARVDYNDQSTLVNALQGQEALIITMSVMAPKGTQTKLVEAAIAANVAYILPNEWGFDTSIEQVCQDTLQGPEKSAIRELFAEDGKSSFINVITGFWYEYSLGFGANTYGMDWKNRTFTFFDDGETKINTITMPQSGMAVAKLLALPIQPEKAGEPCLSNYKNKFIYVSSFLLSQKDMFQAVLRVSGTKVSDWKINYEASTKRFEDGQKQLAAGDRREGYPKLMYSRIFSKDGVGNYEERRGVENDALGLPKEDLDEWTKVAIDRAEKGLKYH